MSQRTRLAVVVLPFLVGGLSAAGCKPDCANVEAEARALLATGSACQADSDCKILDFATVVPGSCVGAFQCAAAVRMDLDVPAFSRQARSLSDEKKECGECIMAGCLAPDSLRAVCNKQTSRCEISAADPLVAPGAPQAP